MGKNIGNFLTSHYYSQLSWSTEVNSKEYWIIKESIKHIFQDLYESGTIVKSTKVFVL